MAVWNKNYAVIWIVDATTGAPDVTPVTVQYQPVNQAYPTGAIAATTLTALYAYKPVSNLDSTLAYDIYVDGSKTIRIFGPDLLPMGTTD